MGKLPSKVKAATTASTASLLGVLKATYEFLPNLKELSGDSDNWLDFLTESKVAEALGLTIAGTGLTLGGVALPAAGTALLFSGVVLGARKRLADAKTREEMMDILQQAGPGIEQLVKATRQDKAFAQVMAEINEGEMDLSQLDTAHYGRDSALVQLFYAVQHGNEATNQRLQALEAALKSSDTSEAEAVLATVLQEGLGEQLDALQASLDAAQENLSHQLQSIKQDTQALLELVRSQRLTIEQLVEQLKNLEQNRDLQEVVTPVVRIFNKHLKDLREQQPEMTPEATQEFALLKASKEARVDADELQADIDLLQALLAKDPEPDPMREYESLFSQKLFAQAAVQAEAERDKLVEAFAETKKHAIAFAEKAVEAHEAKPDYAAAAAAAEKWASLIDINHDPKAWADAQLTWETNSLHAALYEGALPRFQAIADQIEQALGPEHPQLGAALNNLAQLYQDTGRYAEAEPLMERALAIGEATLGPQHPKVAIRLNNLAQLYQDTGRTAEAESLIERALAIDEAALGPEHPNVAIDLNNLAQLYQDTGRYAEAEPVMERALAIGEATLGPQHPKVAIRLNNLAQLYQDTGRYAEAEPLMERALAIDEAALGPEHPNVARDLNNLAQLYQKTRRLREAEPLMERALAITENALGVKHPNVAIRLNNLAQLYQKTRRLREAEPLMERALAITENALGPEHPKLAIRLNNLAQLYQDTGRYAEAEPLMERALAIDEAALGPEHTNVAIRLSNLATLNYATGRLSEAEPLMERALAISEAALGPEHPDVAIRLSNLATLCKATGRTAEAEPLMERALAILMRLKCLTGHDVENLRLFESNYRSLLQKTGLSEGQAQEEIDQLWAKVRAEVEAEQAGQPAE